MQVAGGWFLMPTVQKGNWQPDKIDDRIDL